MKKEARKGKTISTIKACLLVLLVRTTLYYLREAVLVFAIRTAGGPVVCTVAPVYQSTTSISLPIKGHALTRSVYSLDHVSSDPMKFNADNRHPTRNQRSDLAAALSNPEFVMRRATPDVGAKYLP